MAGQNHEIRIKCTKEEHEKIKAKATRSYRTIAGFLKYLALNSNIKVVEKVE